MIIATYMEHRHMPNAGSGWDQAIVFSSAIQNWISGILTGDIAHYHRNHGSPHGGHGNNHFNPPCNDWYSIDRLKTLPQDKTYTEYVVNHDQNIPGSRRLIVSSGFYQTEDNIVTCPVFYYSPDHYGTYYLLKITQVVHKIFTNNGSQITTTTPYGGKHIIFS